MDTGTGRVRLVYEPFKDHRVLSYLSALIGGQCRTNSYIRIILTHLDKIILSPIGMPNRDRVPASPILEVFSVILNLINPNNNIYIQAQKIALYCFCRQNPRISLHIHPNRNYCSSRRTRKKPHYPKYVYPGRRNYRNFLTYAPRKNLKDKYLLYPNSIAWHTFL